jgi:hypothetical protein
VLSPRDSIESNWLRLNRDAWGIENGLHQRLDVSHNDDRCRVRNDNAMLVLGMMLRLSNSLFMQWSGYQRRPDQVTTTDFQSALSEDHHRPGLRLALSKYPYLKRFWCKFPFLAQIGRRMTPFLLGQPNPRIALF